MRYWITWMLLLTAFTAAGQKKPDHAFLDHLLKQEYHREVIHLSQKADLSTMNRSYRDSLHYMRGWSWYALKKLRLSAGELNRVTVESPFYHKSRFFAAYNHAHIKEYAQALQDLNAIQIKKSSHQTLRHFEKAGIALLMRDYQKFDQAFSRVDTTYYPVAEESAKLNRYATDLRSHRKKSTLLGGLMSSVIPGSGKIYAGKTGEGISSLLTVGGLGFVTWENYRKRGIKDVKTLLLGTAFTLFYIGNIYGTVFTIKIAEHEFHKELDHKILFNLHIPLRNAFD